MSHDHIGELYYAPFHDDREPFLGSSDPSSYMSFMECLQGSTDYNTRFLKGFGMCSPSSSSEVFSSVEGNQKPVKVADHLVGGGGGHNNTENSVTPKSSVSFSSSEAGEDDSEKSANKKLENQPKASEDGSECSKKEGKAKKKEKRQKEPRVAFMTKSEVDHLEDGYRWRKYGQKAVKNSPYPRSYYRCTTQKCTVKKRVERSFQDPSVVITTYEGQHNHPTPSTLRGNAAAMLSQSVLTPPNPLTTWPAFPQELLIQMPQFLSNQVGPSSIYQQNIVNNQNLYQYHHQAPDNGLLEDVVPSVFFKQEP